MLYQLSYTPSDAQANTPEGGRPAGAIGLERRNRAI